MNPLVELHAHGQSFWYDNIRRSLMASGELRRMIEEDGLRGMTSNPTIFEKAIGGSSDYDAALRELAANDATVSEAYEALVIEDIRAAADLFRPLYDRENGADGYVSLEVSPLLANETQKTIEEAERLWRTVARPNLMVKVPATPAGIPAIEHLIAAGLNINVTLMFSEDTYEQVAEAYIRGLEKLAGKGRDVTPSASVASLFVSRVDTAVDKLLEQKGAPDDLKGQTGIANSRLLYQRYRRIFHGGRFRELRERGARPQRLLWASTSTKNPRYSDVMYAEALIGPETVDTMPDATVTAFRDHGRAGPALEEGLEEAARTIERLGELGIDLDAVMKQLQDEGVRSFADSFEKLAQSLGAKLDALRAEGGKRPAARTAGVQSAAAAKTAPGESPGSLPASLDDALQSASAARLAERIWKRDPTVWKDDPGVAAKIRNRLGWLDSPEQMLPRAAELQEFAAGVKGSHIRSALLLGMGGSSLCPEVVRNTFGVAPGFIDLKVIDTTDPGAIARTFGSVDRDRTLYIVASKSGSTIEVDSLNRYFSERRPEPRDFAAITDPDSPLDRDAQQRGFGRIFRNPADIGGRYSAISYFGLVPAALHGVDVARLTQRALEMARRCKMEGRENPGVEMGVAIAHHAAQGRDKLTFAFSPGIADFGAWVEQLIAESTGKEGKGILPVVGEPLGAPDAYSNDRVFVALLLEGEDNRGLEAKLEALERAGHPVIRLTLRDKYDLASEFFRWEMVTAVAGAVMRINPFDEPNVTEAKEITQALLRQYEQERALPEQPAGRPDDVVRLIEQIRPGDYIALLAFVTPSAETTQALEAIRVRLRAATRHATTLGFGPRYLHSTGQLHKGGPDNGLFVLFTADDTGDIPVPGRPFTFGVLKRAQALGDLQALRARGRRVVRLHFGKDVRGGLDELSQALKAAPRAAD